MEVVDLLLLKMDARAAGIGTGSKGGGVAGQATEENTQAKRSRK